MHQHVEIGQESQQHGQQMIEQLVLDVMIQEVDVRKQHIVIKQVVEQHQQSQYHLRLKIK